MELKWILLNGVGAFAMTNFTLSLQTYLLPLQQLSKSFIAVVLVTVLLQDVRVGKNVIQCTSACKNCTDTVSCLNSSAFEEHVQQNCDIDGCKLYTYGLYYSFSNNPPKKIPSYAGY